MYNIYYKLYKHYIKSVMSRWLKNDYPRISDIGIRNIFRISDITGSFKIDIRGYRSIRG